MKWLYTCLEVSFHLLFMAILNLQTWLKTGGTIWLGLCIILYKVSHMHFRMMIEHVSEVINFIRKKKHHFLFLSTCSLHWLEYSSQNNNYVQKTLLECSPPQPHKKWGQWRQWPILPPSLKQKDFIPKTCIITLRLNAYFIRIHTTWSIDDLTQVILGQCTFESLYLYVVHYHSRIYLSTNHLKYLSKTGNLL